MPHDTPVQNGRDPGARPSAATSPDRPTSLLDVAPFEIGSVALTVRDLEGVARFYREAIGLAEIARTDDTVRLGTERRALLDLRHDPAARPKRSGQAGLFHTAFLLPHRGDLGAWLGHAAQRGLSLTGHADHRVSEAVYLDDPEGNGVEIYADRPAATWPYTADGTLALRNDPMDHPGLIRIAPGPWGGMPPGGRIGHVHLQVGALEPAERFFAGLLGLHPTGRYPGAAFLGSGGYHHQVAVNVWRSAGAPTRDAGCAGLAEIALLADAETLAAVRDRCRDAAWPAEASDETFVVHDPWRTRLRLLPR